MVKSICTYAWRFSHNLDIKHVCTLKNEHEDIEHYCGLRHEKDGKFYYCASSQFIEKKRQIVSGL